MVVVRRARWTAPSTALRAHFGFAAFRPGQAEAVPPRSPGATRSS